MLDEIKRIFTEGVVLPHFLRVYQNERSIEFSFVLEAMSFLHQLVLASSDLNEEAQFEFIIQTIALHLENYLKYNKKEKSEIELFLAANTKRNSQQPPNQMEVVSLAVLVALKDKNAQLCLQGIASLSQH